MTNEELVKKYNRRQSGAVAILNDEKPCDSCGENSSILVGFERKVSPGKDTDIWVCINCSISHSKATGNL